MESGPSCALISDSLRATRLSASSQLALRNLPSSRISGVVRRSVAIDVTPAELSLHAGGNPIRWPVLRRYLEDVAIFRPDVEAASHAAVRANCFCLANAVLPHCLFRLGNLKNRSIARLRFNALDHVDHAGERGFPEGGEKARMTQHRFFHQRIAGTDGNAVAARNAARLADGRASVPEHTRIRIFPVDGQRFIDLDVLAGLYAAATENALIGIVAVERIGVIDLVGLRSKWDSLMLDGQQLRRVMDGAVAIVVVAHRAVEHVVAEYSIKRFYLGGGCRR